LNQVKAWFAEQLAKHSEIPIERRGEYARAAGVIFERMTPTVLLRLRMYTREIWFYETLEELTADLARSNEKTRRDWSQASRSVGHLTEDGNGCTWMEGTKEFPIRAS
jgi:hypothetical protein